MLNIAIIGGGLSGTLVAVQLLRQAKEPVNIYLIEPREIGEGVAYSTRLDCHLLNVPVDAVSTEPEDQEHFLRWIHNQGHTNITAQDFVPRRWFGDYIKSLVKEAIVQSTYGRLEAIHTEAIDLITQEQGLQLQLRNGRTLTVDRVVLAIGNPPPANVAIANSDFYEQNPDHYIASGWSGELEKVLTQPSVLFIGTGLTTVDWLVALERHHYIGDIHILSRHGLLPQSNRLTPTYSSDWLKSDFPQTTLGLLRWVRREIEQAAAKGI
ncbi:hypothetical protein FLX56_28840, partial [Synechococcus moorigangaii CMS01]|nr:hypothetical protein [Synechococcus moorigangaii CMS01]